MNTKNIFRLTALAATVAVAAAVSVIANSFNFCNRNNTNESKISIESQLAYQKEKDIEEAKFVPNEVILIDSVKINGYLPFRTSRDSIFKLIDSNPAVRKIYEDCSSYGSRNDTLEFLKFNNGIVYIFYNERVEFVRLQLNSTDNYLLTERMKISAETTFEELCKYYPNSCSDSFFPRENERIVRFHPRKDFYESYEFWAIVFVNGIIDSIEYIVTC